MTRHFDEHRSAGHRVPDSFYEDLIASGWDESIRTTYAWSGEEEDGKLTVSRKMSGQSLSCLSCVLNEQQMFECFTTDQMLEHLDEHRTWGLFVADHVYDRLERDRSVRSFRDTSTNTASNDPQHLVGNHTASIPSSHSPQRATRFSVSLPPCS